MNHSQFFFYYSLKYILIKRINLFELVIFYIINKLTIFKGNYRREGKIISIRDIKTIRGKGKCSKSYKKERSRSNSKEINKYDYHNQFLICFIENLFLSNTIKI